MLQYISCRPGRLLRLVRERHCERVQTHHYLKALQPFVSTSFLTLVHANIYIHSIRFSSTDEFPSHLLTVIYTRVLPRSHHTSIYWQRHLRMAGGVDGGRGKGGRRGRGGRGGGGGRDDDDDESSYVPSPTPPTNLPTDMETLLDLHNEAR